MLPNPNPLSRIFNTLLLHALRDGARAIRLELSAEATDLEIRMTGEARTLNLGPGAREAKIHFLIGETWREQMTIPGYVFAPLGAHLEAMQNPPGTIQLRFLESEFGLGLDLALNCEKIPTAHGERLEISIGRFDFEGNYDQKAR